MFDDNNNTNISCSFCGKTQEQVGKIIAGPGVYICDECITLSKEIIDNDFAITEYSDIETIEPITIARSNNVDDFCGSIYSDVKTLQIL